MTYNIQNSIIRVVPTADTLAVTNISDIIYTTPVTVLNQAGPDGSLSYDDVTGVFTLIANRLHRLTFQIRFIDFSIAATGALVPQWVDATTDVALVTNDGATDNEPATSTSPDQNVASIGQIFYRPTTNQTVKVRVISGNGTATIEGVVPRGTFSMIEVLS